MDLNSIYESIQESIETPFSYFTNSEKRIFYIYLISSVFLALLVYLGKKRKTSFIQYLFPKKVWISKSAFIDYFLWFINGFVKVLIIGPILIIGLNISYYVSGNMYDLFGSPAIVMGEVSTLVLYTIAITVIGDFATYVTHLLYHKVPFLWEFHKVHHSATTLNPLTQYRIHPVELIITNIKGLLVFGLVTGFFDYMSNYQIDKIMFLGVNVLGFLFMFFGANLRHSHVKLKYWSFLEKILISPYQHQIHHSNKVEHYDKNLGAKFAIWDWMFGTLILSKSVEKLEFGLGKEDQNFATFWQNLFSPFKNLGLRIISIFKK
jgi:sterol desaturase/sphingolipid hydroxylase (fatty acid hydroxylase superfamily)